MLDIFKQKSPVAPLAEVAEQAGDPQSAAPAESTVPQDFAAMFAAMRKQMEADFKAQLADAITKLRPDLVQVVAVDVAKMFAERNPGIGGAAPLLSDIVQLAAAAPAVMEDGETESDPPDLPTVVKIVRAISSKLDALVQATGHGNSAAMAAHL